MGTLQARKPATEREKRLVTDDIVVIGETTELSEDLKKIL